MGISDFLNTGFGHGVNNFTDRIELLFKQEVSNSKRVEIALKFSHACIKPVIFFSEVGKKITIAPDEE